MSQNRGPPKWGSDFVQVKLVAGMETIYPLPEASDPDNDLFYVKSVKLNDALIFASYNNKTKSLIMSPTKKDIRDTNYIVDVMLEDINYYGSISKTHKLLITVEDPVKIK